MVDSSLGRGGPNPRGAYTWPVLSRLELRDFAIIDELDLDLTPGLNVLSGETGAGKSIVIDALELLAGARADAGLVRAGADSALVQGEFSGDRLQSASRRLALNGRHSARLDGELVSVAELAERCGSLVAVFAQHGAVDLQTPVAQRAQLDRLLDDDAREALRTFRHDFQERVKLQERLAEVEAAKRDRARRLDVLDFQIAEIQAQEPRPGEDAELEAELSGLRNAERILQSSSGALEALNGEESSAIALTAVALRELRSAQRHVADLGPLADELDTALTALSAVSAEVEAFVQGFDADPARLDAVQARLAQLETLKRKYGNDLSEVLAFLSAAVEERQELQGLDEDEAELRAADATLERSLSASGARLTAGRQAASERLERETGPLLKRLGMPNSRLLVKVAPAGRTSAAGLDEVAFLFSANTGEAPGPLSQIASGGELSRLMLALHLVTGADQQTLAFDEIDAGVGGRAAHDVGALLGTLARDRQVLVVTHLAQVAAFADTHFVVSKGVQDGRTVTTVERLDDSKRPAELARMLSGSVTAASLEHAAELLDGARQPSLG